MPADPSSPHSPNPIIDLTGDPDPDTTTYPTIGELLRELDEDTPSLEFSRYEEGLVNVGIRHVHEVIDTLEVQQSFDQLEIPVGMRQEIFERASRMVRRAGKSKQISKTDGDHNPLI